jgi:hypothetical protein
VAFSVDATSASAATTSTGLTHAHTCAADARLLVVGVIVREATAVNGVTYGGQAMTRRPSTEIEHSTDTLRVVIFDLFDPIPNGANNVVVSLAASTAHRVIVASFLAGAGKTAAFLAGNTAEGASGTAASVAVTFSTSNATVGVSAALHESGTVGTGVGADEVSIASTDHGAWVSGGGYEIGPTSPETFNFGAGVSATWVMSAGVWEEVDAGGAAQTITPSAIASAEAVGADRLILYQLPSAIASAEAIGTPRLILQVAPSGIGSAEVVGAHRLNLIVRPTGLASGEAVGVALIHLRLSPGAIASAEAFGVERLNFLLRPSGLPSAEGFGSGQVHLRIFPGTIASAEALGSPIVSAGALFLVPGGIPSAEAFGTLRLAFMLRPSSVAPGEAFGTARLVLRITPSGVGSAEAHGIPGVAFMLRPTGLGSVEAVGALRLALQVRPEALASLEAFGSVMVLGSEVVVLVPTVPIVSGSRLAPVSGTAVDPIRGAPWPPVA